MARVIFCVPLILETFPRISFKLDISLSCCPIGKFESGLLRFMHSTKADFMKMIDDTSNYNDEIAAELKESIETFKRDHSY